MYPYVTALMLLGASFGVLGLAIPKSSANGLLSKPMEELSERCKNTFLSSQIKAKLNECSLTVPPYNEKQFQCLIFYDINNQLCNAVSESRLVLENDYTSKVNEEINVEKLCVIARDWNFTTNENYPIYKETVAKAFSMQISCMKICGNEEVTNLDTNFFCKYYKWGYEKLNTVAVSPAEVKTDPSTPNLPSAAAVNEKTVSMLSAVKVDKPSAPVVEATATQVPKEAPTIKASAPNTEITKPESKVNVLLPITSTKKEDSAVESESDVEVKLENSDKPPLVPVNEERTNAAVDKPSAADMDKDVAQEKDEDTPDVGNEVKDATPLKTKGDDDYQDSEDREGLPDGGDDGDDPVIDNGDMKQYVTQLKTAQKTEPSMSFSGERKFYKNNLEDDFVETDDHFFSFFVTAVILVVVLYVLYHNKSKVTKVFLGLIVEGRQPGRRRNSRGHAYRRLDTLEQAMSTNSAAPPSKIIY